MIIFSEPTDWKDLQDKVCLLLCQAGFIAEKEKIVSTPRGQVELDVYAIDPDSIDQISYVLECKHWKKHVNQSVIHSFMTIMNETGCNIGYIVSKNGFQSGAINYVNFTNIRLFTFDELQKHYYKTWMKNYFAPNVERIIERLVNYTEPYSSKRDKALNEVSDDHRNKFRFLLQKYAKLAIRLSMVSTGVNYMMKVDENYDYTDTKYWEQAFEECEKFGLNIKNVPFSDILNLLEKFIGSITAQFDELFDNDIFEYS